MQMSVYVGLVIMEAIVPLLMLMKCQGNLRHQPFCASISRRKDHMTENKAKRIYAQRPHKAEMDVTHKQC